MYSTISRFVGNAGGCWCVSAWKDVFAFRWFTLQYSWWGWEFRLLLWRGYKEKHWWHAWFGRGYTALWRACTNFLFHGRIFGLGQHRAKVDGNSTIFWLRGWTCSARKRLFWIWGEWFHLPPGFWKPYRTSIEAFCLSDQHGQACRTSLEILFELRRA